MALGIGRLLRFTSARAFDVDDEGRVLAGTDETGTIQLVEIAAETSTTLTDLPGAVKGRYLPGERAVIVEHDTQGDERGQLSLLRLGESRRHPAGPNDLEPLVAAPAHVHRLLDVLPGRIVYATNRRNGIDFDIVVRNVATGAEEVVYDGGGMVMAAAASPDGRFVALTLPGSLPMSDQLVLVDTMPIVEGDRVRALTGTAEHARYTGARWFPDDSGLAVTTNHGREFTGVATVSPGAFDWLVTSTRHDLAGWLSPDGTTLLVHTNDNGTARWALHDAESGDLRRHVPLPADGWCLHPLPDPVWSPDSRFVALSFSSPSTPGDVLLLDAAQGEVRTCIDTAEPAGTMFSEPAEREVPARDGERIPCLLYSPPDPDPGLAGSVVIFLHGGPEGQSVRGFNALIQGLVDEGHTVLAPNVRGSTGYGKRWYSADDRHKRLDAVDDLADVHEALPGLGLDPSRAALLGGSYGGYLTLAGLAFQPERWAAGVVIAGISSLLTFLQNTAAYRRAHREREYGFLHEDAEFLRDASPLTWSKAISAPLFMVHGANDPRVPASEAHQLVDAVRSKGIECELLVYDDEGHGLANRANRLDAYPRALAFLAKNLRR